MSAVEKIHQLPLTPRDLVDQFIADAVDNGGDTDTAIAAFLKGMKGRYRGLLDAALVELFEFYMDGKTPKKKHESKLPRGKVEDILRRAAQRAARVQEAALFLVRLSADMTMHDAWMQGGKLRSLGRRNDKRKLFTVHPKKELERAGFCLA